MEMCYDGALALPSSYVVMDEDEMTYVEGGASYTYKKGDYTGVMDCYTTAMTLAYFVGVSSLMGKISATCSIMAGPVATVFSGLANFAKWACTYFALQFFNAGEAAKAMYKRMDYTITVNTFLGIPTTVICS